MRIFLCLLSLLLVAPGSTFAQARQATVLDGVYTTAQASRGRTAYNRYCRDCHLNDLEGGALEPPLVTDLFLDAWREDYLLSLYDFISTRMPKGKKFTPGSLETQQYLDIVSYILSRNEFPAGKNELTTSGLASILLVGLDGPQPLPPNAMVRVVGCFAVMDSNWRLLQSSQPVRVRTGDETSVEEVTLSAAANPGDGEFLLNNLDIIHSADELPAWTDRKVQVKGVLNGSGTNARIFVLSLEDTGVRCAQ